MTERNPTDRMDVLDAVLSARPDVVSADVERQEVAALVADLRDAYTPADAPARSAELAALTDPERRPAPPPVRRRSRRTVAAFAGTAVGKVCIGGALAAAAAVGITSTDVLDDVDVPFIDDAPTVDAPADGDESPADGSTPPSDDGADPGNSTPADDAVDGSTPPTDQPGNSSTTTAGGDPVPGPGGTSIPEVDDETGRLLDRVPELVLPTPPPPETPSPTAPEPTVPDTTVPDTTVPDTTTPDPTVPTP